MLALDALDVEPDEIDRRFARSRSGPRVGWLWPNVDPDEWRRALASLAAVARQVLTGVEGAISLDGDPAALCIGGYTSGMGPLVGYWLENGVVSADDRVTELFILQLRHNRLRMQRLTGEAIRAVTLLDEAEIGSTILKGMHTAYGYFPEPGTRPCSDIDLLVTAEAMGDAERCLEAGGYSPGPYIARTMQRAWQPEYAPRQVKSLMFVHADDPWSIDLQASLNRHFATGSVARLQDLSGAYEPSSWAPCERANVLPQPLLLLQLAAHASQGMVSLTLIRLVELILVIRRDQEAGLFDWSEFERAAQRIGALGFVYPAFRFAEEIAPGTVPAGLLATCEAATPPAVRRYLSDFSAATIHRIDRWSLREGFMWCDGWASRVRQFGAYLAPVEGPGSLRRLAGFYRWRLRCAIESFAAR